MQAKREIQGQAKSLFEGKRRPQPVSAQSAPDRLSAEIWRLKRELEWLKKNLDQPPIICLGWIGVYSDLTKNRECMLAGVSCTTI